MALLQGARPFSPDDLSGLRDISLDLEFVEGVTGVASPFALRLPPEEGTARGTPLFGPTIGPDYPERLARFDALETGLPTLINPDRTALLMVIDVASGRQPLAETLAALRETFAGGLPEDTRLTLTGEDAISAEIVGGLKTDLVSLNLWGGLLVVLAALVLMRDPRMALLAVVPALCSAAAVLALSVWLGYPVTVLSNVVPLLLLVLGVADGVHLAGHLKTSGQDVEDTIRNIGPACALTGLTTAAAFAGIMVTGNDQLFEFAVLGATGALMCLSLTLVIFALLGRVLPPGTGTPAAATGRVALTLCAAAARRPLAVTLAALALLVVSTGAYLQNTPWFPLYQNLPRQSATLAANDAIAKDFGGVFQMVVEVPDDWETLLRADRALSAVAGPQAVLSQADVARWAGSVDAPPDAQLLGSLPAGTLGRLETADGGYRLFVSTPEPMRNRQSLARFDALEAAAFSAGAARVIGLPALMRHEAVHLISQLSLGLLLAAVGGTLIVALAFRSPRIFALLLVPNLLPLMVTGGSLMIWAGGQLTPTAVLALTIAFGIAIDDSVHFLNRYREARRTGKSSAEAVETAARSAGQVMVMTTVLLTAGLGVTAISDFFPIRLFGGMMILTLWTALLCDLLLLPALLLLRKADHHGAR
ncbi:RND transporter [Sulfitobacter alexandrii]|uniref:RND transporter n=1 Tax=Sulfitobacter alexandrii TaxID=1917485 RepID=A0A1J0WMB2_9RHOB|nr:RND transporter [Sulfitobacter alexandrii]